MGDSKSTTNGDTDTPAKVNIVSNRLPVSLTKLDGHYTSEPGTGGLVSCLGGIKDRVPMRWFGWPNLNIEDPEEQNKANEALAENCGVGIFLDGEVAHSHYNVFSNGIAWPILHYQSGVEFYEDAWTNYNKVNEFFATRVAESVPSGETIWVHDYQLFLVPLLLREKLAERGKKCPIGFTLHTPFPAYDFWRALPIQREILKGVLAADVLGFHTVGYKRNFIECCVHGLGASVEGDDVLYNGRRTHAGTYIVGMDPGRFLEELKNEEMRNRIQELESQHKGKTVILGVDRLDYTKGLVQKLAGYDHFLNDHPELKGKVVLIQVAIPSREDVKEYQELRDELNMRVGQINGNHSTAEGSPIVYMHHPVNFEELTALYRIADACLISCRRDGMNMVAGEYVACQKDRHGVLVLSEFCGIADYMHKGAITFNPSSALQVSRSLHQAINMDKEERKRMYLELEKFVTTHTSAKWGEEFMAAMVKYASDS